MAGDAAEKLWTVADFLVWEGEPDRRYELVDSRIVAMAPAQVRHGAIVMRIGGRLLARLPSGCNPIGEAGIRLVDRDDTFYVADIAVTCAPLAQGTAWVANPILIVEVLSPSTVSHDRGQKVPDYCTIASVREILLVDSEKRHVQLWSRHAEGWLLRDYIGDSVVPLACIEGGIGLDDIYDGL